MRKILNITILMFAFAFILTGFETANAQWRDNRDDMRDARRDYRRRVRQGNYQKAMREYREDMRDARRERRVNRRGYYYNRRYYTDRGLMGNGSRYYYYRGRMIRRR